MVRVGMDEAKAGFSRLVQQALEGEDVVITRHGTPVVRLVPVADAQRTLAACRGRFAGEIVLDDDFDALEPEIAELFGVE